MVLAIFALVTKISKKIIIVLDQFFYICYLIQFKKNKVQALINFGNKVNVITLEYILQLRPKVCFTKIGMQKIDIAIFEIFKMVLASF